MRAESTVVSDIRPGPIPTDVGTETDGETVSERSTGLGSPTRVQDGAENDAEIDRMAGPVLHHYIDPQTAQLRVLSETWMDFQQMRKAATQRDLPESLIADLEGIEDKLSRSVSGVLRKHVIWPWLSQYPGLRGVHTARLIGRIANPHRFPGQKCSDGHTLAPGYAEGDPCPIADWQTKKTCSGLMLAPRTTTGVRSVWHYCGLHADADGKSPRKRKGVSCSWDPIARASVLQEKGIADQIVRHRTPIYSDIYYAKKEKLAVRVGCGLESDTIDDPDGLEGARVVGPFVSEPGHGLRPFQADDIARKVAAKAFVGDLLIAWKECA